MSDVNKYASGKIYKIVGVGYTKCYIGSTTEPTLARRMAKHRGAYTHYQQVEGNNGIVSSFSLFDEFVVENCKIELVWRTHAIVEMSCCPARVIIYKILSVSIE